MLRRNRKSIRLPGYDYSQPGHYFVTICTHQRAHLFGEVGAGKMILNPMGLIADACWRAIPEHYPHVRLDAYVIMPNHVHGIVVIDGDHAGAQTGAGMAANSAGVAAIHELPLHPQKSTATAKMRQKMLLPKIVGRFKMNAAKQINILRGMAGVPVWQRNYYEHIVRDGDALVRIRRYIQNNPAEWHGDRNFAIDPVDWGFSSPCVLTDALTPKRAMD